MRVLFLLLVTSGCTVAVEPLSERDPEPAPAAAPDLELAGEISSSDRAVFDLWVSRPRNRYRLQSRRFAVVGTLQPPEWSFLLDLEARTAVPNEDERHRELLASATRQAAYRTALRESHAASAAGLALFPTGTPCEDARATLGGHAGCERRVLESGVEQWRHATSARASLYGGFRKNTTTVEHDYDPSRRLLLRRVVSSSQGSGPSTGPSLRVESLEPVDADLFRVPAGYRELDAR